jgi:hypothetical protein
MKIRIGDYSLSTSASAFRVSEIKKNSDKDSEHFGEEYESEHTYPSSLENALNDILNRKVKESDAVTLEQLLKSHTDARNELRELWGSL